MQNIAEQFSSNSSDEQIIKSLKSLRAITLDDQWKRQEKARIFAMASHTSQEQGLRFSLAHALNWALNPLPAGAFAVMVSMLTGGFAVTVFLSGGFQPAVSTRFDVATIVHNAASDEAAVPAQGSQNQSELHTALNKRVASSSGAAKSSSTTGGAQTKSVGGQAAQSLSSLELYGDDTITAFRTFLREKLNRIWVMAQENGNEAALSIAEEAEKFYAGGDYDAVLRAVSAAEALLEKDTDLHR